MEPTGIFNKMPKMTIKVMIVKNIKIILQLAIDKARPPNSGAMMVIIPFMTIREVKILLIRLRHSYLQ